jgi:hypothetical protein
MRASLHERVEAECVEPIVSWLFDDPGINRLLHHEYLEAFAASGFEIVKLGAERDPVDEQLLRILGFRYPKESAFDVTNAEVTLRRPATARRG